MLISFTLENWRSFRNETTFSMVASREKQHKNRVPFLKEYDTRILPISAVYGGNSSGKSNFVKALAIAKQIITNSIIPGAQLPYTPFKLNDESIKKPTKFGFVFLVEKTIYEYIFSFTKKAIIEEKLIEISSKTETTIYSRNENGFILDKKIAIQKDDFDQDKNEKFIRFALEQTPANQLFLTRLLILNFGAFKHIYNWFKEQLVLILPYSFFNPIEQFIDEKNSLYFKTTERISDLDTGIEHFGGENISLSNISENLKRDLQENLSEGHTVRISNSPFIAVKRNGEIELKKLVAYHLKEDGTKLPLDFLEESDGTQRLTDLLPAFFDLENQSKNKVYVIDELDRSMHTFMTRKLLEYFLEGVTKEYRSLLIFTTHDVMLMDQELLRRDEMRLLERDPDGNTSLYSISDYKVRFDTDIRKKYLEGRFGAIPKIFLRTLR